MVTTLVGVVAVGLLTGGAGAASKTADAKLAKAGVLTSGDFPDGFRGKARDTSSDKANAKLAKSIPACTPYRALQKLTDAQPQAKSQEFEDDSRQISNEVDVFGSVSAAKKAMALFANADVETCLNTLFEKVLVSQLGKSQVESVDVAISRQDVDPGGDDSVVYEGNATVNGTDGSQQSFGLGQAAVRVGRGVDAFSYFTSEASLTDILQPLIDASLGRLEDALVA